MKRPVRSPSAKGSVATAAAHRQCQGHWPMVHGPPAPPRFRHAPSAGGTPQQEPKTRAGKQSVASDHPIRAGGIEHRQQLLQHRSYRRAALRVVHRRKDPRRDAGLDLLEAHRAVHQQLDADGGGRQRHGHGATAMGSRGRSTEAAPSGRLSRLVPNLQ